MTWRAENALIEPRVALQPSATPLPVTLLGLLIASMVVSDEELGRIPPGCPRCGVDRVL